MTQRNNRGFTLIELMIVVAIIGLLAGIGYPSYTEYVMRGKRSEARSGLLDAGAKLERYYSDNAQYADLATAGIQTSSDNGHYTISVTLANGNQDFTLRATPATFKIISVAMSNLLTPVHVAHNMAPMRIAGVNKLF